MVALAAVPPDTEHSRHLQDHGEHQYSQYKPLGVALEGHYWPRDMFSTLESSAGPQQPASSTGLWSSQ